MKRIDYLHHRLLRPALLSAAALLLAAACTTDNDPVAEAPGTALPTGAVPFTFTALPPAAITDAGDADAANATTNATTRTVPGKDVWKGDGTEKIGVRINYYDATISNFRESRGTYTVTSPEGDITVAPGDVPAFWQGKVSHNLYVWYPAAEGYYDISDQSTPDKLRQADFLWIIQWNTNFDFGSKPALQFMHRMTKVRVELTGVPSSASSDGDIKVEIWGYTPVYIVPEGDMGRKEQGYITACRDTSDPDVVAFEALRPDADLPTSPPQAPFIRITAAGRTYSYNPGADSPEYLDYGKRYTYRIALPATTRAADAAATSRAAAHATADTATRTPVPLPAPVVAPF